MKLNEINRALGSGDFKSPGVLPHLERLNESDFVFDVEFGLEKLPTEPGILVVRGARQYGKSTWLEQQIASTIKEFGAGSAFYLNGESIADTNELHELLEDLSISFDTTQSIRRIFIDEITAIDQWEIALKRLADAGNLKNILVVTTGSKATDLRRGSERLPGRKGKLDKTNYLFTPISYKEFNRVCGKQLKEKTLISYLLSGGSPVACAELASSGYIPEYVIELVRDWIEGEITASGRNRQSLLNIFKVLFRFGGNPVGQAKLAREAGLSNNSVAAGYIDLLNDLGCVTPSYPWDQHKQRMILRKPCKYHFSNLLAALVYHPARMRRVDDFYKLSEEEQGTWMEWLISQELLRRSAIQGEAILEPQSFWQNKHHEIDFVSFDNRYIESKRGQASALEFAWFVRQFPNESLIVINANEFKTSKITGETIESFLLENDGKL